MGSIKNELDDARRQLTEEKQLKLEAEQKLSIQAERPSI